MEFIGKIFSFFDFGGVKVFSGDVGLDEEMVKVWGLVIYVLLEYLLNYVLEDWDWVVIYILDFVEGGF